MSRTYRRKKKKTPKWVTTDSVISESRDIKFYNPWKEKVVVITRHLWVDVPRTGKDLRKHVADYHADKNSGYHSVPKEYCKMIDRIRKAKDKAEVKRIMIQGDYEEYNFEPWVRDAGWSYW